MCLLCKRSVPGTEIVSSSRRSMLGVAAAGALVGAAGMLGQARAASPAYKPGNVMTPDEALARLMQGNERYASNQPVAKDFASTRSALAAGQNPYACILGCADSRVGPELCFDEARGDLFVTRIAGNFVTNEMLASLEYGVAVLKAKFIMVLGHTSCGAMSAAVSAFQKSTAFPGHIQSLATALKPAVTAAAKNAQGGNLVEEATKTNVRMNVKRLQDSTPVLRNMVRAGALKVAGAVYHLDTGRVELID
jgi:carbonic anhydrase